MTNPKIALITGITGQDGSYLAELLLAKGYVVHGIRRRSSSFNTGRIEHILVDRHESKAQLYLHFADLTDSTSISRVIDLVRPDEIYNLGAQSHVHVSFETPEYSAQVDALGTLRVLEAARMLGIGNHVRIYQASSSELFGNSPAPQDEETQFRPESPYGAAKLYAYWVVRNYREAYGMFACNGILFNHESPRRGETFVTRKITRAVASIFHGLQSELLLGNLDALRDWGHAKDYVEGMWMMLQREHPEDYVLATGQATTVRDFATLAFLKAGIELEWGGDGIFETARDRITGHVRVRVLPEYFRPTEVFNLRGDASKAKRDLGWEPRVSLDELVSEMVDADLRLLKPVP
jgi:GDPmannose 4,6-dehydratase